MKLDKFIKTLERISDKVDDSKEVEVKMADFTPVVKPILKGGIVFITDIEKT